MINKNIYFKIQNIICEISYRGFTVSALFETEGRWSRENPHTLFPKTHLCYAGTAGE
jgi:hypothetical protein